MINLFQRVFVRFVLDEGSSVKALCHLVPGIQGPIIVAHAGDRVVLHFKNLASQPYSISPVGISYWKQSEGDVL